MSNLSTTSRYASPWVRAIRLTRITLHTFYGLLIGALILPLVTARRRDFIISQWARDLLTMMNVEVIVHGNTPSIDTHSIMFVANHISWIDIHALNSIRAVRFISKSEVREWPIFGRLASNANTLFIDRTKKQEAGRIVELTAQSLNNGDCLCYFPEGTTTDGTSLLPFKGSLMQAVITHNLSIWPVAIRYPNADGSANIDVGYYGDISLLASIWNVISLKKPVVVLDFLPKIASAGHDRRSLTLAARQQIVSKLNLPQK